MATRQNTKSKALKAKTEHRFATPDTPAGLEWPGNTEIEDVADDLMALSGLVLNLSEFAGGLPWDHERVMKLISDYARRLSDDLKHIAARKE